jgi:hypothetical protein
VIKSLVFVIGEMCEKHRWRNIEHTTTSMKSDSDINPQRCSSASASSAVSRSLNLKNHLLLSRVLMAAARHTKEVLMKEKG